MKGSGILGIGGVEMRGSLAKGESSDLYLQHVEIMIV